MTKLTNLEQVIKGFKMGWSATIKYKDIEAHVVSMLDRDRFLLDDRSVLPDDDLQWEERYKITGYLYAGQLAGNEIPEGQKFRVKESNDSAMIGNIYPMKYSNGDTVALSYTKDAWHTLYKSEIEPYFN